MGVGLPQYHQTNNKSIVVEDYFYSLFIDQILWFRVETFDSGFNYQRFLTKAHPLRTYWISFSTLNQLFGEMNQIMHNEFDFKTFISQTAPMGQF